MRASKPMPVPIPAFALVLRPEGVEVGGEVVVCIESAELVFVVFVESEGLVYVVCVELAGLVFVVCVELVGLVFVGGVKVGWEGSCIHISIFPFSQILQLKITYLNSAVIIVIDRLDSFKTPPLPVLRRRHI